jgi:hypothetical protein
MIAIAQIFPIQAVGPIFIGIVGYLVLSYSVKASLRKKMDFGAYFPKIDQPNLASNMKRPKLSLKELFERYEVDPKSPVKGISGTLSVNLSLEHHFAYRAGKSTSTHIQMLLTDTFFVREFSSLEAILDSAEISVPAWFGQSSAIMDAKGPVFVRKISIAICYDDFPDHMVTVEL